MNQPQMYKVKLLSWMNERYTHTWQSSSSDKIWCMCMCTEPRGEDPKSKTYVSRCQKFVAWSGKGNAGLGWAFWMHLRLSMSSFWCEFVVQNDELYVCGCPERVSFVSLTCHFVGAFFFWGQSRWIVWHASSWIRYFLVGIWISRKMVERAFVLSAVVV
jgi:hypothetical protein